MKIKINIPDKDIPKKQDIISIDMHFIDGQVCECDYPFAILPSGGTWIRHENWRNEGYAGYECPYCGAGSYVKHNFCPKCEGELN